MDSQQTTSNLIVRLGFLWVACVALSGCFFMPGQYQSELDIRSDGRFTYRYQGEVVFLFPQERIKEWDDSMAKCTAETKGGVEPHPCTTAEAAAKRQAFESERRSAQETGKELAELIGFNPLEPGANERLAEELKQYPGWKDVRYAGKGTFYVDYELSGALDRDFAFPVVPQVQMAMPFVNIAPSKAGVVNISAGGLASQQLRNILLGQMNKSDPDDPFTHEIQALLNRSNGTFSVTTDAEISATNGNKSGGKGAHRIEWNIEGATAEAPSVQLVLGR